MRRAALHAAIMPALLMLGGCASSLSGLDGNSTFSCKAPDGVLCSSLSGVYANALQDNLPGLQSHKHTSVPDNNASWNNHVPGTGEPLSTTTDKRVASPVQPRTQVPFASVPSTGAPIRTAPKILRVWIAPWEDADGDLHDQSYLYVVADPGRWMVEHNQRQVTDRYRPAFLSSDSNPIESGKKPAARQQVPTGSLVPPPGAMINNIQTE